MGVWHTSPDNRAHARRQVDAVSGRDCPLKISVALASPCRRTVQRWTGHECGLGIGS